MPGVYHQRVPPATYSKHLSWERSYDFFRIAVGCLLTPKIFSHSQPINTSLFYMWFALTFDTNRQALGRQCAYCPEVPVSYDGCITTSSALFPSKTQLHHAAGPNWFNAIKIQMPAVHVQLLAESEAHKKKTGYPSHSSTEITSLLLISVGLRYLNISPYKPSSVVSSLSHYRLWRGWGRVYPSLCNLWTPTTMGLPWFLGFLTL